jgi:hypothetical protein
VEHLVEIEFFSTNQRVFQAILLTFSDFIYESTNAYFKPTPVPLEAQKQPKGKG